MIWAIAVAAIAVILMLFVGAKTTVVGPWYRGLRKPRLSPPDWVFAPAWTLILACAGWAGVIGWTRAASPGQHGLILVLYAANVLLHMLWSPLFFNRRRPDWALIEIPFLWLSILALIIMLAPLSTLAACLLLPYLLWVSFAAYLNASIVRMNRPFDGRA